MPDTRFDVIWRRYEFDRFLRLLVLDGIERVEIAIKTRLTNIFTLQHGAFGYLDRRNLPKMDLEHHESFLQHVKDETNRSKEEFLQHFQSKYGDFHDYPPLWIAVEVISFGTVLYLFNGMADREIKLLADEVELSAAVLKSWLLTLNYIRNLCAHHGRLWNRELSIKPKIPEPENFPAWHTPVTIQKNRVFSVLSILRYFLWKFAPHTRWQERLTNLLEEYQDIPRDLMGFPKQWEQHTIWNPMQ